MGFLDIYTIPFKKLEQGEIHRFEFQVDDEFFAQFETSEIQHGSLTVKVDLVVNPDNLVLDFRFDGEVEVQCDVCLDFFMYPLNFEERLYVRLSDFSSPWYDYDEEIFLSREESRINIAKHIYDYINLALPMRKVHPAKPNGEPGCDPDMLRRLQELSVSKNFDYIDPRWEQLKDLLN